MSETEDIIIVGTGIAGLRVATELLKVEPTKYKITFVEKYGAAGGRMETIHLPNNIQYESGAGRIHSSHTQLLKIVKQHNLTLSPMSSNQGWRSFISKETVPNDFLPLFNSYCELLRALPKDQLQNKTIRDLLIEIQGVELAKNTLDEYPYRAELEIMSADAALDLFASLELGKFLHLNEGFSELIKRIVKNLQNVTFKFNTEIQRIQLNKATNKYTIKGIYKGKPIEFNADRVILAVPQKPLENIFPFSPDHPLLKKVRMEPLLRIYSIYKNSTWFPKNSIITDSPLRYIIPIDKSKGLIMSSYLDSRDIEPWRQFTKPEQNKSLIDKIQNETQTLFPELIIPKAEYTKAHLWSQGCSYWLPNTGDYRKTSKEALEPMPETYPRLHLVGESFSKKQQWIEGALEHADELVDLIINYKSQN